MKIASLSGPEQRADRTGRTVRSPPPDESRRLRTATSPVRTPAVVRPAETTLVNPHREPGSPLCVESGVVRANRRRDAGACYALNAAEDDGWPVRASLP